jgi:hypothetical protein
VAVPLTHPVELSVTALTSVIRQENLGQPHTVLAGGDRYLSPRFRSQAHPELRDELARAGLDEDFRDTLALVQYARVEYYGWITTAAGSVAALVAVSGRAAVLLVRDGDRVTFDRVDPDRAVASLIRRLPEVPAGRGESITVPAGDYTTASAEPTGYLRQPETARSADTRRLDALLRAPRLGGAQLYAAGRDRTGNRHRARECLSVLDIAEYGRWAVYATAGRGARAVNAVPATPQLLATKLEELRQDRR